MTGRSRAMRGPARNQTASGAGRRRVRAYSRAVAWMKVLLPLAAVALIAAIFVSARDKSDLTKIFTAEELATLGAGLRLDNPRFAGHTPRVPAMRAGAPIWARWHRWRRSKALRLWSGATCRRCSG